MGNASYRLNRYDCQRWAVINGVQYPDSPPESVNYSQQIIISKALILTNGKFYFIYTGDAISLCCTEITRHYTLNNNTWVYNKEIFSNVKMSSVSTSVQKEKEYFIEMFKENLYKQSISPIYDSVDLNYIDIDADTIPSTELFDKKRIRNVKRANTIDGFQQWQNFPQSPENSNLYLNGQVIIDQYVWGPNGTHVHGGIYLLMGFIYLNQHFRFFKSIEKSGKNEYNFDYFYWDNCAKYKLENGSWILIAKTSGGSTDQCYILENNVDIYNYDIIDENPESVAVPKSTTAKQDAGFAFTRDRSMKYSKLSGVYQQWVGYPDSPITGYSNQIIYLGTDELIHLAAQPDKENHGLPAGTSFFDYGSVEYYEEHGYHYVHNTFGLRKYTLVDNAWDLESTTGTYFHALSLIQYTADIYDTSDYSVRVVQFPANTDVTSDNPMIWKRVNT